MTEEVAISDVALFDLPPSTAKSNDYVTIINRGFAFLVSSTDGNVDVCNRAKELGRWLYDNTNVSLSQWTQEENGLRESTYRLAQCIGTLEPALLPIFKRGLRALFEVDGGITIIVDKVLVKFMLGFRDGYERNGKKGKQRNSWSFPCDHSRDDKLDEAICAAQILIELGLKDVCVMKAAGDMGFGLFANIDLRKVVFSYGIHFISATTLPGSVRRTKVELGDDLNQLGDNLGIQYPVMAINSINHVDGVVDDRKNCTVYTNYVHRNTIRMNQGGIDSGDRGVGQKSKRSSLRLAAKFKYEIHNSDGILISSACLDEDIANGEQIFWDYPYVVNN
jgi:hypothetical protein